MLHASWRVDGVTPVFASWVANSPDHKRWHATRSWVRFALRQQPRHNIHYATFTMHLLRALRSLTAKKVSASSHSEKMNTKAKQDKFSLILHPVSCM